MIEFKLAASDGAARTGTLVLTHGTVDTPAFMPVGTYGTVKAMSPAELNEIGAQIVLKATKVDGVYSADPKKDPNAKLYREISFDEAIARHLQVMDATAFALCRDQKLPIKVFNISKPGALKRVVQGDDEGTLVHV